MLCVAASHARQLPIAIGGGAVALLIVVGLAAFCMRKSNKEAGADNVQPVELGSQSHDRQVDVSLGVEPKPGMDDNSRVPAPSSPKKGAGYGNLDDEATTYVGRQPWGWCCALLFPVPSSQTSRVVCVNRTERLQHSATLRHTPQCLRLCVHTRRALTHQRPLQ